MLCVGAKLHPGQKKIAEAITNTPHQQGVIDFHTVVCTRQWGKSFLLTQMILWFGINEPGSKILFISMTYAQANKIFNALIRGITKSNIIEKKNASENSIILINGTEIFVRSYQKADNIRGLSATTLLIDESAFVKDDDWNAVFRPTLATLGKRCILFSTPKNDNWFKKMYDKGLSDKYPNYHSYHSTYRENPYANLAEIQDAKASLPDKIYRAEYEAEFISGASSVFENYKNCTTGIHHPGVRIAAIDVGNADDWTVLCIMDGNKVVSINRWRHNTFENIIQEIVKILSVERVRKCYCEVNSLGSPFFEFLCKHARQMRVNTQMEAWTTTNQSKANIIEQLMNDFVMQNIIIPDKPELMQELDHFTAEYSSKSKAVIYGAESGYHDDICMALAICNFHRVISTPNCNYHIAGVAGGRLKHR